MSASDFGQRMSSIMKASFPFVPVETTSLPPQPDNTTVMARRIIGRKFLFFMKSTFYYEVSAV